MTDLSKALRQLRIDVQLNQEELAKALNISRFMVSSYENGREPPLECLVAYAKHFNVSCDWLLGLTADKARSTTTIDEALNSVAQMMKTDAVQPLSSSEINDLAKRLESYYHSGAPAGATPISCIRAFLGAMCGVLEAASEKDLPGLLEKTNVATAAVLSVNDIFKAYME